MNETVEKCSECWKTEKLCICDLLNPIENDFSVLILQHPQEARNELSTARLISLTLKNSLHKVGLSWRSLSHAVGFETNPKDWGVLFLGSLKESKKPQKSDLKGIKGIVLLDGNWKQSKTLWWRNPWLLKLKRVILNPETTSAYNEFRRQPRKNSLSTIEACSHILKDLKEPKGTLANLEDITKKYFEKLKQ
jgi:DTW domain-containing protein YfiP